MQEKAPAPAQPAKVKSRSKSRKIKKPPVGANRRLPKVSKPKVHKRSGSRLRISQPTTNRSVTKFESTQNFSLKSLKPVKKKPTGTHTKQNSKFSKISIKGKPKQVFSQPESARGKKVIEEDLESQMYSPLKMNGS